jgi:MHS family shikimate/dehydroshikimate transporter-like MFS transporter
VTIAAAFGVILVPVYGRLSDRYGRKAVYGAGTIAFGVFAIPSFMLINTGERGWMWLGIVLALGIIYPAIYAPLAAFWSELFSTHIRYTGVGAVYQFSGILASGLTPVIGAALVAVAAGSPWLFVAYMMVVTVVSLTCLYLSPETYRRDIYPLAERDQQGNLEPASED